MAFVSMSELRKFSRTYSPSHQASLTVRHGTAYITKAVYGDTKPSSIEVQIDAEKKQVRLRTGEGLSHKLCGRVGHTFSFPKAAAKEVIPSGGKSLKIILTSGGDGWWYGEYQQQEEA
ncbi:hypothetical protein PHDIMM138B_07270 [Phytobacter diazotrophicus]